MYWKTYEKFQQKVSRKLGAIQSDVYKRFDDSYYGDQIFFGVVNGVFNNGEKTHIEATENKYSYGEIDTDIKIIGGEADVSIFPATLEELEEKFGDCERRTTQKIDGKKEELKKLEKALETTRKLVSGELQRELKAAEFKELPQSEFSA